MPWQAEWLSGRDRARLPADLAHARRRGRVPASRRAAWWAGVVAVSLLGAAPEAFLPGVVLFEALVAPHVRTPRRRPLGRLAPWHPPESWRPSPEAPADTLGRP